MGTAIKVQNLSKAYQLGEIGTGTISRDLERYWARLRGKEDPFLRIGETNDRTTRGDSDIVWSLKDLNFEIEQGEAIGIIGRNGAGKSTLLKILSRVTTPTAGSVKIKGRVASLLEVGTGFHPELTGRENIFLNGAILGMRKVEIKNHFDAIVDFAGVERHVDTPVKRYSSGMYVRLAFAVAAHLESEILVVDEVLAVGDAEFQKKCLGKMNDISKGEGRTVLFVSHNMAAISALCVNSIILSNGVIKYLGNVNDGIEHYNSISINRNNEYLSSKISSKPFIKSAKIDQSIDLVIKVSIENEHNHKNLVTTVLIRNSNGEIIFHSTDETINAINYVTQIGHRLIRIPQNLLNSNEYFITLALGNRYGELFEKLDDILSFKLSYEGKLSKKGLRWKGIISPDIVKWQ